MKLLKRITAVMAALLIVVNLFFVNTFAAMAAPVVGGGEFAEFLIGGLSGSGHSKSDLDGLGVTDLQDLAAQDLRNGNLALDSPVIVPNASGTTITFWDYITGDYYEMGNYIINEAFARFARDYLGIKGPSYTLEGVDNFVVPTSIMDMKGLGSVVVVTRFDKGKEIKEYFYSDYVIVYDDDSSSFFTQVSTGNTCHYVSYVNGVLTYDYDTKYTSAFNKSSFGTNYSVEYYGDVRYDDGTEFPTFDVSEYVIGDVDGTKVTVDMLNPDGTVTIDGVTYDPADYVDPDKLTDEGQAALVDAISDTIDNTYVNSEDKPIVDADEITVEVAEEFQDYAVPVGIANVFPFCIPWDIVRGFQLLNRPAVTPKFEIPFNIPAFGLFPGVKKSIVLDFSEYDTYIQIFRWFQIIGFSFLLCKLSLTRVKGAGA